MEPHVANTVPSSTGTPSLNDQFIHRLIDDVITAPLAPRVDAFISSTWRSSSHFKAADYLPGEGEVDREMAVNHPTKVQMLRTGLVLPSPTQPRGDMLKDEDRIGRMILNVASKGIETPLLVRLGEEGKIFIVSGHTRSFCAINAGQKFIPCRFQDAEKSASETLTLIQELASNLFRRDMNDADKARGYLRVLETAQREHNFELTTDQAIALLHHQLDCSESEALQYLQVSRLASSTKDLFAAGLLTLERAASIAESLTDPATQHQAALAFVARDGSDAEIIDRYKLKSRHSGAVGETPARSRPPRFQKVIMVGDVKIQLRSTNELSRDDQIQALELAAATLKRTSR